METTEVSKIIFNDMFHYRTSPFGEIRSNGRTHNGTDYGCNGRHVEIYVPYDNGIVRKVHGIENIGNERGLHVIIEWPHLNLGMIFQHLDSISGSMKNNIVNRGLLIGKTGMTGTDKNGKRVSTGIHLHVEVYYLNTNVRFNFEELKAGDEMLQDDVLRLIESELKPNDSDPDNWAKEEWEKATELGITTGEVPKNYATRQEVAAMLMRLIDLL